ncbi:MAG TPA: hypothetical protein VGD22_03555 [Sphingobacteriaceae bacterium]
MSKNIRYPLKAVFFVLLLSVISCKKVPEPEITSQANPKSVAQTSSIVTYARDNTTSVTKLDCTPGYTMTIVYSIGPLTVQAGDVVTAHMQRELTYSGSAHVMYSAGILIATSPSATTNTSSGYLGMASPFAGNNLYTAKEGNIAIVSRNGSFQFTQASSSVYINAVFYGATLGEGIDMDLPVGNNYGELVAVVERGVTRYSSTAHHTPFVTGYGYTVPLGGTQYVDNSVGPITIPPYTMVDVRYQNEITSDDDMGTALLRIGRKTIYTSSASSTTGVNLTSPSQVGMLKYTRHLTASHAGGAYFASSGATDAYFNSILWAYDANGFPPLLENGGSANYLYGNYSVELRPYVYFAQDLTRNITAVDATERVLYSVGPLDIAANQVVEVRYVGSFGAPASILPFRSRIVRATSPTAVTGVTVQSQLYRKYGPSYMYNQATHSTAERPATAQTGQYYNVVVSLPSGGSLPVMDWGELEVIKR